jgi:hypothetical protein
LYLILRRRADIYGDSFDNIIPGQFEASITDATTGNTVNSIITNIDDDTYHYESWDDNPSVSDKVIVVINNGMLIDTPTRRVRTLDCVIKDTTDNSFIVFRIFIADSNLIFSYINIKNKYINDRPTISSQGTEVVIKVDGKTDQYLLLSPFAYLEETEEDSSNFSYPLGSIFYKRQQSKNREDFRFEIISYNYSPLLYNLSFFNIIGYQKVGVLLIDKNLYQDIQGLSENVYVDLRVTGLLSEISQTFRVFFNR